MKAKKKTSKKIPSPETEKLKKTIQCLKNELEECRSTLEAIRNGEVDALVVNEGDTEKIFTLKNADQPYRIFVETMNEGAATLSRDGVIYYCNHRFAEMIERPLESVIGNSIYELFPHNDLPNFSDFIRKGKDEKGIRALVFHSENGVDVPLQLSMSVVDLENSPGVCVVATDLSEQHRLEESRADIERLNIEKEVRERFVSTLTHDLRTPLTAGLLAGQLLMRKEFSSEDVKKIAKRIAGNMERADGMIRDLLDTNRIKAGEGLPISVEACSMQEIVNNAVRTLSDIYGPRFLIEFNAKKTHAYWDPIAIQRCIENLASNAVKYGLPKTPVTIQVKQKSEKIVIGVHNEGKSISKEDQKILFTQYRRSDSAVKSGQKGWGIGLTLVKGFMEAHGGQVSVKSDEKNGTTFFIELPFDSRKLS